MGENAILELRTVNVKDDVKRFTDISGDRAKVIFDNLERELNKVDVYVSKFLRLHGFSMSAPGVFEHDNGSRIVGTRHMDPKSEEWCSAFYRGYGNPMTVTPVIQAINDYFKSRVVKTTLTTF